MSEPGLDLHEWETRWQELQDEAEDAPAETLPEVVRLVGEMLEERRLQPDVAEHTQGDDAEALRAFRSARDTAQRVESGAAGPGDVAAALNDLRDVYGYLVTYRPAG